MKIAVFTRGSRTHSYIWEVAFLEGLRKHRVICDLYSDNDQPQGIQCGVTWGIKRPKVSSHLQQIFADQLILERGYIGDRHRWTSCGFNGLNGRADFLYSHTNARRADLFRDALKPYKENRGEYILIMGQVPTDASVFFIGFHQWLSNTIQQLSSITDRPIFYRPHPLDKNPIIPNAKVLSGDLESAIHGAHCVVTLNSNSGVDSILAGIPTISMDMGSMVYSITDHDLHSVVAPKTYDRTDWINNMAYTQWTLDEIRKGDTWDHLRNKYN